MRGEGTADFELVVSENGRVKDERSKKMDDSDQIQQIAAKLDIRAIINLFE